MSEPREEFTAFALTIYRSDGVPDATLLLQDRCGLDVNVLLLGVFIGAVRSRTFGPDDCRTAQERVEQWQQVVVTPLRTIRRQLKHGPPPAPGITTTALRDRIKQIELDAEMIELDELADVASGLDGHAASGDAADRATAAMAVVVRASTGREPTTEEQVAIATIAEAAAQQAEGPR